MEKYIMTIGENQIPSSKFKIRNLKLRNSKATENLSDQKK